MSIGYRKEVQSKSFHICQANLERCSDATLVAIDNMLNSGGFNKQKCYTLQKNLIHCAKNAVRGYPMCELETQTGNYVEKICGQCNLKQCLLFS